MTVRLTVDRAAWMAHLRSTAAAYGDGLVPVVKGNGYGFGRPLLHDLLTGDLLTGDLLARDTATGDPGTGDTGTGDAATRPGMVCVGTVHEVHDVPAASTPVVLTPTLTAPGDSRAVLTVGSIDHVHALAGWHGSVIVKLASSMRRYGATPDELGPLLAAVTGAGLQLEAFGVHLPLAGNDTARLAEIRAWLPHLPPDALLWVSHLEPSSFEQLRGAHPTRRFRVRIGTALWHGVPRRGFLHLSADVLQLQQVRAGDTAGYFHSPVRHDGTLVVIGAGSTHGVAAPPPSPSGPLHSAGAATASPFHFARHPLPLLERPHMHTSLAVVPNGQPCPRVGDRVDVQRPLISTVSDELEWT